MDIEATFFGAAGMVTGFCVRIRHPKGAFLIDCGLFQGTKSVKELNWRRFPFDPEEIGAVVLTHAHIDHAGLLPKLVRHGFKGPIWATPGTVDLSAFTLPDAARVQEQDVERLNRRLSQRGDKPVEPAYSEEDALEACRLMVGRAYDRWFEVMDGVRARFWDAGHILGSASVELELLHAAPKPLRLIASGDIGPGGKPFHPDPDGPAGTDWLILESTYGDRLRPEITATERRRKLADIIEAALAKGGVIMIPAFAVERTQELLYDLDLLFDERILPTVDVFLDSPLAVQATAVFGRHLADINVKGTPHPFTRHNLHLVQSVEQSKLLSRLKSSAIVIAGSGMCDAGRIRHHLKQHVWRPNATVLITGYQAPGTLGRLLVDGEKRVRIMGEEVEVRAEVKELEGYSGHADRDGLIEWARERLPVRGGVFLVHGENQARQGLKASLAVNGYDPVRIFLPELDETVELGDPSASPVPEHPHRPRLTLPEVTLQDAHNLYAKTLIDLNRALKALPDDEARARLLARIREDIVEASE